MLMKNVFFSYVLILGVECNIFQNIKRGLFNIHREAAVRIREFQNKPVTYDNVTYYLYTIYNPDRYIQLNADNLYLLRYQKIVFFIHGWISSKDVAWYRDLTKAFLEKYNEYYIVQVDWKDPANQLYYVSSINTADVAKLITQLITDLVIRQGISFDDLILIGHSLGGQIAGLVGKHFSRKTGIKLPRIIALDPAGPLFNFRPEDERLNRNNAEVVEVIHTDGGIFGFKAATGTLDFFPNSGSLQPGCWNINFFDITTYVEPIYCSHQRAYKYFVNSILHPTQFIATNCSDWSSYENGGCDKNTKVLMGDIGVTETGNFYLETKTHVKGLKDPLDERLRLDFFNIYKHAAIATREVKGDPVTAEDVTFYLNANNISEVQLNQSNLDLLHNKKIVFLIHGWINNKEVYWYEDVKNAFLKTREEYSIVEVDWRKHAFQYYYVSSISTYDVAELIANLIVNLNKNHGVSLDNVLLIGHSLGGHITGFVGKHVFKQTGQKLPRIIALDPAGPLFVQRPEDERLNKNDAEIVEVIHSDGGTFGFEEATGSIDFFPNGGKSQPGCKTIDFNDITSFIDPIPCDHFRAGDYFVEAILNPNDFPAQKCASWDSYKEGKCEDEVVTLGNFTKNVTGKFYLETNKNKPFAKNGPAEKGLISKLLNVFHK